MVPTVETIARLLAQQGITFGAEDIARQVQHSEVRARRVSTAYGADEQFRSLFDSVLPDGSMKGLAKIWSYNGACTVTFPRERCVSDYHDFVTGHHFRDLSNWNYACAGRYLAIFLIPGTRLHHWLDSDSDLNDVSISDIFEASLGYCWRWEASNTPVPHWILALRDIVESFLWSMEDVHAALQRYGYRTYTMSSRQFAEMRILRPCVIACN